MEMGRFLLGFWLRMSDGTYLESEIACPRLRAKPKGSIVATRVTACVHPWVVPCCSYHHALLDDVAL
jgi:hypothetical protein